MKVTKLLAACAAVLGATCAAEAQTVVHITGSSAFRSSTITAIQTLMGGNGSYKAAFQNSSGTSTTASNQCVIQGTIPGMPAGANPVTVKCSWSGSVGGIQTLVQNLDVGTWMSVANLPATNISQPITTTPNYSLDTTTFSGENAKADIILADNATASAGFDPTGLVEAQVGIIPFEWVGNNGIPAGVTNLTPLLAQAILSGGLPLSQLTGVASETSTYVYAIGRNFDSGTRLSLLAETGIGVFGGVQQLQPTIGDVGNPTQPATPGTANAIVTHLKLYPSETILGHFHPTGDSGYSSGGTAADVLATPGSATAEIVTGVPPAQRVFFKGHIVGYVGRSDAVRAVRTTTGVAGNTARRLKWNGLQIWNDPVAPNGTPASYNDNLITEGLYNLWEYEYLTYKTSLNPARTAFATILTTQITNVDAALAGLKLDVMNVSKPIEGGLITHN